MNFIKKVFTSLYALLMVSIGSLLLLISFKILDPNNLASIAQNFLADTLFCNILSVVGAVLAALGAIVFLRIMRSVDDGGMLTFRNPDGDVTIAISAVEEILRKIARDIPEIFNIRIRISSKKNALHVRGDVTIKSQGNLAELTEFIQRDLSTKLQSMLGIQESIVMAIHVVKVIEDKSVPVKQNGAGYTDAFNKNFSDSPDYTSK
ncbi:MAG: alkaline shock response membrane anchor protein AmaP [Candidatus Omnitrophica bacterium]|nr:alkaline shock response membrane anchor protein AmaP [Candidatus Omnitrophota bacterium]